MNYQNNIKLNSLLTPTLLGKGGIKDWVSLMKFASQQGIYAIVWDFISQAIAEGRIPAHQQPSKQEKIQWAFTSERHAAKYHHRNTYHWRLPICGRVKALRPTV